MLEIVAAEEDALGLLLGRVLSEGSVLSASGERVVERPYQGRVTPASRPRHANDVLGQSVVRSCTKLMFLEKQQVLRRCVPCVSDPTRQRKGFERNNGGTVERKPIWAVTRPITMRTSGRKLEMSMREATMNKTELTAIAS